MRPCPEPIPASGPKRRPSPPKARTPITTPAVVTNAQLLVLPDSAKEEIFHRDCFIVNNRIS